MYPSDHWTFLITATDGTVAAEADFTESAALRCAAAIACAGILHVFRMARCSLAAPVFANANLRGPSEHNAHLIAGYRNPIRYL